MRLKYILYSLSFAIVYGGLFFALGRSSIEAPKAATQPKERLFKKSNRHKPANQPASLYRESVLLKKIEQYQQFDNVQFKEEALRLRDTDLTDQVLSQTAFFTNWAKHDPKLALEAAKSLNTRKEEMIALVLAIWSEQDPKLAASHYKQHEKALFSYDTLSPWRQISGAEVIAHALAKTDPTTALQWASQLGHIQDQAQAVGALVKHLTETDANSALELFSSLEPGGHRDKALQSLAENWGKTDPQAAIAWYNHQLEESDQDAAIDWIIAGMAKSDPQLATQYLQYLPGNRDQAILNIVEAWSEESPQAAGDWLMKDLGDDEYRYMLPILFEKWLPQGASNVKNWILNVPDDTRREESIFAYVKATTSGRESRQNLLKMISEEVQSPRLYELALSEVIVSWSRENRDQALAYANQIDISESTLADIYHRSNAQTPLDIDGE